MPPVWLVVLVVYIIHRMVCCYIFLWLVNICPPFPESNQLSLRRPFWSAKHQPRSLFFVFHWIKIVDELPSSSECRDDISHVASFFNLYDDADPGIVVERQLIIDHDQITWFEYTIFGIQCHRLTMSS